jgi:hypothetical protein
LDYRGKILSVSEVHIYIDSKPDCWLKPINPLQQKQKTMAFPGDYLALPLDSLSSLGRWSGGKARSHLRILAILLVMDVAVAPRSTKSQLVPLPRWHQLGNVKIDSFLSEVLPQLLLDILNSPPLGGVSVFDGCGTMKRALTMHSMPTMGFDMQQNADEDIDTEAGFLKLVLMILRVVPQGLVWFGVPCCSWIWMCRSVSRRTKADPAGNTDNRWVQMHNRIADRVSSLLRLCHQRGVYFVIEQPAT